VVGNRKKHLASSKARFTHFTPGVLFHNGEKEDPTENRQTHVQFMEQGRKVDDFLFGMIITRSFDGLHCYISVTTRSRELQRVTLLFRQNFCFEPNLSLKPNMQK